MKKLFLALAIVCGMTTVVNAQEKGQMWISGNVGLWSSEVEDGPTYTDYRIVPEFGYQFANDWGVGIQLGYVHDEFSNDGKKMKVDGFTVKPFARYSFLKGNYGGFFVDGGAGYTYGKNKTTDIESHTLKVGFQPGVYFKATNHIFFTGKVGFLGYQYEKLGNVKTNSFGLDFDMKQVELGINIVF